MATNKFYTKEKEIEGKKYIAQFNGMKTALMGVDQSYLDNSSNMSILKISDYVLSNVIVEPAGLTVDDFETMEELNEVVKFGMEVMQGKFRTKEDKATVKKASK